MLINIRYTGHNNRPRLWLAATPTATLFGTAIHVFLASSRPWLPCIPGCHDLSYLTIHNIDRRTMLINIRNTGINKRPWLSLPAKPTATIFRTVVQVFSASMCPHFPRVLAFHFLLAATNSHTSQFITSTALPCPLTLEIQERIVLSIVHDSRDFAGSFSAFHPFPKGRSPAASTLPPLAVAASSRALGLLAFLPSMRSYFP